MRRAPSRGVVPAAGRCSRVTGSPGPTALGWRPAARDLPQCDDLTQVMGVVHRDMRDGVGKRVVGKRGKLDWRIDAADGGGFLTGIFRACSRPSRNPLRSASHSSPVAAGHPSDALAAGGVATPAQRSRNQDCQYSIWATISTTEWGAPGTRRPDCAMDRPSSMRAGGMWATGEIKSSLASMRGW
jgi:hypothetical protein